AFTTALTLNLSLAKPVAAAEKTFTMTEREKALAALLQSISQVCNVSTNDTGKAFWRKLRKRAGVKTVKVGTRKKPLPSGNVDHVSVYETRGFEKIQKQIRTLVNPMFEMSCKQLYQEARRARIWDTYYGHVIYKNGKAKMPPKPPRTMVRVDGKVIAVINSDGVITYAKGRDTPANRALVKERIAKGEVEIW
ncbi:MAG: hypothetical protein J4F41_09340, partial [Alphaproteobacteria bacterium]|nr:hypothetical protein [Alphaproteobacteria bacterium]